MSEQTARLALPIILPAQAQKHVTHNEALEKLDLVVQLALEAFDALTPPADPQDGQIWALGATPSGVWAGQAGRLAAYIRNQWEFVTPAEGWIGCAGSALRVFDGTNWVVPQLDGLQNLPGVGVNTSFDATNRLAVAADATLLSHEGAGHQLKINKAAAADTASLLFQTGWSGRAEMGTAGSDDFSIKVSADGATWNIAAQANSASGELELPNGATINGQLSGTAVTQNVTDTTSGRLLKTGDFGLGAMNIPDIPDNDANEITATGFYRANASTLNVPLSFSVIEHTSRMSGAAWQKAYRATGASTAGLAYIRIRNASGWQPWRLMYNQENIVGTVSQSGGVPTGAILHHGSNANGEFLRFADGTQICWHTSFHPDVAFSIAVGALFRTSNQGVLSWIFPASFVSAAMVIPARISNLGAQLPQISVQPVSVNPITSTDLVGYSATSATMDVRLRLLAIGCWY